MQKCHDQSFDPLASHTRLKRSCTICQEGISEKNWSIQQAVSSNTDTLPVHTGTLFGNQVETCYPCGQFSEAKQVVKTADQNHATLQIPLDPTLLIRLDTPTVLHLNPFLSLQPSRPMHGQFPSIFPRHSNNQSKVRPRKFCAFLCRIGSYVPYGRFFYRRPILIRYTLHYQG